jgi:hypothetical protein
MAFPFGSKTEIGIFMVLVLIPQMDGTGFLGLVLKKKHSILI